MMFDAQTHVRLRLGISACLLGQAVRFDGGHKRNRFLVKTLAAYVDWVAVCPELELGLGVPRETLRLEGSRLNPRLISKSGIDHTDAMHGWAKDRLEGLALEDLDGYVLKKDSPSCGAFRVRLYDPNGVPSREGQGLFARALQARFPDLPMEEEGRLEDPRLRENFIERIFSFHRWRCFLTRSPKPRDLVSFHASHKLALMSHSPEAQVELGRIVSSAGIGNFEETLRLYGQRFHQTLRSLASRGKNTNVLQHLLGFFKERLDSLDREELATLIERYRLGELPLIVPLTLFAHHIRRHDVPEWVRSQTWLKPYPEELLLRTQIF